MPWSTAVPFAPSDPVATIDGMEIRSIVGVACVLVALVACSGSSDVGSSLACTGDCDCSGSTCTCKSGGTCSSGCDVTCPSGGCKVDCSGATSCSVSCGAGGAACDLTCGNGKSGSQSCAAGSSCNCSK